ncbi:hypothetical protein [uncultured Kordia sp.]|uniref:toxin-antitoxin system YwqK family antitoxin n=1 Tax=uncultured Kordia sp. TaxID=507699 RepID=UPI0026321BD7|nr:hypothetical protein [uncultured Kordia sp.]
MKRILYILFLILSQTVFGQIRYEPTFINQCTDKVEENVLWYVTDSDTTYGFDYEQSKSISLPKLGTYQLHYNFEDPIKIEILDSGVNRDTLLLKKISLAIYVSNPPHSEYFDCDSLANGKITDFYMNGNKRMQGVFKNGQPVDSLFSYHRNGQLSELFIQNKKSWKKSIYFKNGQLHSVYNTKKRFEKEYYQNGQIKKERSWSKKYHVKSTEYFQNGQISKQWNRRKLKIFNKEGNLIEKIKRKEFLVLRRIFSKDPYERNNRFYKYKWETFTQNEMPKRKIVFHEEGFLMTPFPDSIQQIKPFLFDNITFFKNGQEIKKLESKFVPENGKYIYKLFIYRKEENEWIEEKVTAIDDVHKIITAYSK